MALGTSFSTTTDEVPGLCAPHLLVLIPFRDTGDGVRSAQLSRLKAHFQKTLLSSSRICIIEQSCDGQSFNRGQLLNIGFAVCVAKGRSSQWLRPEVVVVHDVNIAPDEATVALYSTTSARDPVRVFTAELQRFGSVGCFGGVVAMLPDTFESVNGFPNTFWGHAGEDAALQGRLRKVGTEWTQHFGSFESLDIGRDEARINGGESLTTMKTLRQRLTMDKRRWRDDGLSSVDFSIVSEQQLLEQEGWGIHLVVKLGSVGVRCGRCQKWQPEDCYSKGQALQRGPVENTVCKTCLAPEHRAVEENVARNQDDEACRSCETCGKVFPSRSQLFKHLPICGETTQVAECIPCNPVKFPPRPTSPRQTARILDFTARVARVAGQLPTGGPLPSTRDSEPLIRKLIAAQTLTFQSKATNVAQLKSLLSCVEELVTNRPSSIVLDLGAGKALFTRSVYEMLQRQVPVVALDNRAVRSGDPFYDPVDVKDGEAPYTRLVAEVQDMQWSQRKELQGEVVAVTKHLCGGFTDASLVRVCEGLQLQSVCMAPCCHQKLTLPEYCNHPYLKETGFETEREFKDLLFLIQLSKHSELKDNEYRNRSICDLLPFAEIKALGCLARRLLEEGRACYLRDRGFDVEVRRYISNDVTPDNLVIMARKLK